MRIKIDVAIKSICNNPAMRYKLRIFESAKIRVKVPITVRIGR